MDGQQAQDSKPPTGSVRRRGVLAGIAALAAGGLTRTGERVAQAANGDPLTAGNSFTETNFFRLTNTSSTSTAVVNPLPGDSAVFVGADQADGARGYSYGFFGFGLWGISDLGKGVVGTVVGTAGGDPGPGPLVSGIGVMGQSGSSGGYGVRGDATGTNGVGVRGNSGTSSANPGRIGVLGIADPAAQSLAVPSQAAGVYGLTNGSAAGVVGQSNNGVGCQGSSNGNVGVLGVSNASIGVFANSINSTGLYATSGSGTGIVASTNNGNAIQGASNGNVGVLGTSNSSIGGFFSSGTSTGLYATGPGSAFAARFDGPVQVNGAFTVLGGPKSAAVPHPDGSHRRLYCMESPESWFEDFGRDQLVSGQARVRLDADFDALVQGDNYYVFLTEHGDQGGLYVDHIGPHAFTVRARNTAANAPFSYRVVAKRKDIAGPRLERVDIPAAPPRPAAPPPPPAIPALEPPRLDPNANASERGRSTR
ncbi:MAG TPA: hypothetical protein VK066_08285 [Chloroflexota bacterium]|nr:hypothetical protein [Chloroflexota bacterium]